MRRKHGEKRAERQLKPSPNTPHEHVLTAGQVLTMRSGLTHAVRAQNEAAFLLTLASEATHPAETAA